MSISSRYKLLIVDRNRERLRRVVSRFDRSRFAIFAAVTGQGGLRLATKHHPDVVLIGPVLEDGFGMDLCGQLARDLVAGHPLIFLLNDDLGDESMQGALSAPAGTEMEHAFLSSFDSELESRVLRLLRSRSKQ